MVSIEVSTVIDAPRQRVWSAIDDVGDHVEWMADAEAIRFTSEHRSGVGTTFECDTRVGPIRLTDVMAITEWDPGVAMGVRHEGLVTGSGRFTLSDVSGGRTRFTWAEELAFPWWLGGAVGARIGRPVLTRVWRGNLGRLRRLIEGQT